MAAVANGFIPSLSPGYSRQWSIAVIAFVLMAGGVLLSIESMTVDDEVRARYEEALALSQLALETQQSSAQLRIRHARTARSLIGGPVLAPVPGSVEIATASATLATRVEAIGAFALSPPERTQWNELVQALQQVEAVTARLAEAGTPGKTHVDAVRELDAISQLRFMAFDESLSSLVGAVGVRTVAAARRADDLNAVARYSLIGFSAISLLLGLLLGLLVLRTLRANRALADAMQQLAREDALTGAVNRRGLDHALPIELARSKRSGEPLTLVMLDLDHFKRYNDRRGHPAGDAVLRGAAQAWLKQLRPTDMLARYGGEEFTIVLPGTDTGQAVQLVERLRDLVPDRQTFSAGIARWDGHETATQALQRADHALLQAKKAGRNRTVVAGEEPQVALPLMVA